MIKYDLKNEIELIDFDNGETGYMNISGNLVLFKDNKIIGIMNKNGYEIFVIGKKRMNKIWIYNPLQNDILYNLSNNIMVYKKNDIEYEVNEKLTFKLKNKAFNLKEVDILNRKIQNNFSNITTEDDNINRALLLKNI